MTANGERLTLDRADGTRLTLLGEGGRRFRLEIDDELREAVRRSHDPGSTPPTAGPEEGSMDTSLRPRDIQARIRAGATAQEVADASGATVEKVLVYARPVLAERAHMAQRAQRSSVRRAGGDASTGHRTLGDAVAKRLRAVDADPDAVEWDSRKREDGRWVLTASYTAGERSGLARFTYDLPGNFVTIDDDDARWLLGDEAEPAPAERTADPEGLRLVGDDDELPLGGDALRLVAEPDDGYETYAVAPTPAAAAPADRAPASGAGDETAEQLRIEDAGDSGDARDTETPGDDDDPDGPDDEPPSRRRVRKRGGRASVPSWDEIMFGGGRKE